MCVVEWVVGPHPCGCGRAYCCGGGTSGSRGRYRAPGRGEI